MTITLLAAAAATLGAWAAFVLVLAWTGGER
jgi:hypothetical protein